MVGLGPGDVDLLSPLVTGLLDSIDHRFVRTRQHPAASLLDRDPSFDHLYERLDSFADVYEAIAAQLFDAARVHGRILYAVPGSPLILERTVELLRTADQPDIELVLHPAMSFLDVAWAALAVDPIEVGASLIDGHQFETQSAGRAGPMLVAHCHANHVLSDIKISAEPHADHPAVTLLHHLGLPDQQVLTVPWFDMDRAIDADHLTSLWIPGVAPDVGQAARHFAVVVERLRSECPWDAEQTHRSLRRFLVEESAEAIDALDAFDEDSGEGAAELVDEFGDLLFQVWLHAQIASETGLFDLVDILDAVSTKLQARHPHVFGDAVAGSATEARERWEAAKYAASAMESSSGGQAKSAMDGIPPGLPVLLRAMKVRSRAAGSGTDPQTGAEAMAALRGAIDAVSGLDPSPVSGAEAVAAEELLGSALLAIASVARHLGIDPDRALEDAVATYAVAVRTEEERARQT